MISDNLLPLRHLDAPMSQSSIPPSDKNPIDISVILESGEALFRSGDEADALPRFEQAAALGSAPAMTWLGYVYLKGKGATVDAGAALQWFTKAAEAGDAEAMNWIGRMYESGNGVVRDKTTARNWYLKAAEAGDADGQHCLAAMFDQAGEREEAERWIKTAADQGYAPSIEWINNINASRLISERRYAEAIPALEKSADGGSGWAHENLGYVYWNRSGAPNDLERALRHYEAAYHSGRHSLANPIGGLYFRLGRPDSALSWYRRDNHSPISSLYWQYRTLRAHPRLQAHSGECGELLREAAGAGHVIAKRDLALLMMQGRAGFGTRLQGLREWLGIFRYALRIVMNDENDERLR
jgi:TPR repeat protein